MAALRAGQTYVSPLGETLIAVKDHGRWLLYEREGWFNGAMLPTYKVEAGGELYAGIIKSKMRVRDLKVA